MDKTIEPVNFDASQDLINQMDTYFDDLITYNDQITSADIYLKVHDEKATEKSEVQIKVFVPGHEIFADAMGEHFTEAAHNVFQKVKRQLRKAKEQDKDHYQPREGKAVI